MTLETALLVPLVLSMSLLGTVAVNEATHGSVAEMMGAGHHHLTGHDHPHCDQAPHGHHHHGAEPHTHPEDQPHHGPHCEQGNQTEGTR